MTYLQVYNAAYLGSWVLVWALSIMSVFNSSIFLRRAVLYGLLAVQTSMVMETVHSLVGLSSAKPLTALF